MSLILLPGIVNEFYSPTRDCILATQLIFGQDECNWWLRLSRGNAQACEHAAEAINRPQSYDTEVSGSLRLPEECLCMQQGCPISHRKYSTVPALAAGKEPCLVMYLYYIPTKYGIQERVLFVLIVCRPKMGGPCFICSLSAMLTAAPVFSLNLEITDLAQEVNGLEDFLILCLCEAVCSPPPVFSPRNIPYQL